MLQTLPSHAYRLGILSLASLVSSTLFSHAEQAPDQTAKVVLRSSLAQQPSFGTQPLHFAKNLGQANNSINYIARSAGYSIGLSATKAYLNLNSKSETAKISLNLVGANNDSKLEAEKPLAGHLHYLTGSDSSNWITNIPTSGQVRAKNIYPGIDLVYYGNENQLEHDFIVQPGVSPDTIRWSVQGADHLSVAESGDLNLSVHSKSITFRKPVIYQTDATGAKIAVEGKYLLLADKQVGFQVATYDTSKTLVIDPVLAFSTYIGGSSSDAVESLARGTDGSIYSTGTTYQVDTPVVGNDRRVAPANADVFVTKLTAAGALVYTTYLGGNDFDSAHGIAVDSSNSAYVVGETYSNQFPVLNAKQPIYAGQGDAFLVKLSSDGASLIYSTYYGGPENETAKSVAVGASNNPVIVGTTFSVDSTNLVSDTANGDQNDAYQPELNVSRDTAIGSLCDMFVAKYTQTGSAFVFATYYGTIYFDFASDVALDLIGNTYIVGQTAGSISSIPRSTGKSFAANPSPGIVPYDPGILLVKLSVTGTNIATNGYNGTGVAWDYPHALALDGSYNVYIVGETEDAKFSVKNAQQPVIGGQLDGFLMKVDSSFDLVRYSTYLGGSANDVAYDVATDKDGGVYVVGGTLSDNFPIIRQFINYPSLDYHDAFITKYAQDGLSFLYSVYLGGENGDVAKAVAVTPKQEAYVAGETFSSQFPLVSNLTPFSVVDVASSSGFISKISDVSLDLQLAALAIPNPDQSTISTTVATGEQEGTVTLKYTVTNVNSVAAEAQNVVLVVDVPKSLPVVSTAPSATQTNVTVTGIKYTRCTFNLNQLTAGANQIFTISASADIAGRATVFASVTSDDLDTIYANNNKTTAVDILAKLPTVSAGIGLTDLVEGANPPQFNNAGFLTVDRPEGIFIIARTGSTADPLVVNYTVTGTATAGSDYTPLSLTETIPAGSTSTSVNLQTLDDSLFEGAETVILSVASVNGIYNASTVSASATVNILDNEQPPTVSVVATDATGAEPSDPITFTVTRSSSGTNFTSVLRVFYNVAGTATSGSDYTVLSGFLDIPSGSSTGTITITPINDSLSESDETVSITLANSPNGLYTLGTATNATGTIADFVGTVTPGVPTNPDGLPIVSAEATDNLAVEPVKNNNGVITFTRTGDTARSLVVKYRINGPAKNGRDYAALNGFATIKAGRSSVSVTIRPLHQKKKSIQMLLTPIDQPNYKADSTSAFVTIRHASNK